MSDVVPSAVPSETAGESADNVSCISAALLTAHPRVFAAGRYIPLVGTVELDGMNAVAVNAADPVTAGVIATTPDPLAFRIRLILVSLPSADIVTPLPVAPPVRLA